MRAFLLSLILAVALTSGCAMRGPANSFCGPLPGESAVTAIADDAVSTLASLYPPGHTTLRLLPAKGLENGFAVALEKGLRAKGFTLAPTDASGISVAYTLDRLDEKAAWYLQLRLSDGNAIARAYASDGSPEAGQSRIVPESSHSGRGARHER